MLNRIRYLLAIAFLAFGTVTIAAPYPLEITQPQPNLNTDNRFYRAYPGLEYNVRPAVFGGVYPFTYQLTQAPTGMSIDARTGEIVWPKPTTTNSPHSVSLRVTDSQGTVDTVSWTITVTQDGFAFIDANNGKSAANGGTGTITNPWRTISDFYGRAPANTFVYFRKGTYYTYVANWDVGGLNLRSTEPVVWLAYPGEQPVVDMTKAYIRLDKGNDAWFSGFKFQNMSGGNASYGFLVAGPASRGMWYKNHFYRHLYSPDSKNQAPISLRSTSGSNYIAILDNVAEDTSNGYGLVCSYKRNKVVVEGNTLKNIGSQIGIGLKDGSYYWSIRGNTAVDDVRSNQGVIWTYNQDGGGNYDISFNLIKSPSSGRPVRVGAGPAGYGEHYFYRNTFIGGQSKAVTVDELGSSPGPVRFKNNVIVNEDASWPQHISSWDGYSGSKLVREDNLAGRPSAGIVDTEGMLTAAYAEYRGTHGHHVDFVRPLPPELIEVQ